MTKYTEVKNIVLLGLAVGCTIGARASALAVEIFSDDFNRPDSNTVGGGWSEIELGPSEAVIMGDRLHFPGGAVAFRDHGGSTQNVTVKFNYSFSDDPTRQADAFNLFHNGSHRGAAGGLFIILENDATPSRVRIIDVHNDLAVGDVVFEVGRDYCVRWDVFSDYSMELRI